MKKDDTRFTVRFNPTDPRQQSAIADLNASGRRKAALIADALYYYRLLCNGSPNPLPTPIRADFGINQPHMVTARTHIPTKVGAPVAERETEASLMLTSDFETDVAHTSDTPYDADMCTSILDAMSIFSEQS